jgi:alpha-amylase
MLLRFQFGLWQGFNWESWKSPCWYDVIAATANDLAEAGVTDVWFPPASHSVAPQGIWTSAGTEYI